VAEIPFEDRLGLFQENKQYYLLLLVTLLLLIGVFPLFSLEGFAHLLLSWLLILTLLTGVLVLSEHRINRITSAVSGSVMVIAALIHDYFLPYPVLQALSSAAGMVFFIHVSFVLLYDIFSYREKVVAGLLYGAISVYLLIGISFTFGFTLIELLQPDSFKGLPGGENRASQFSSLLYFSFVTITTLGYGDISPLTRQTAVLCYLEAIAGQMYLTILVPRLVGMYISRDSE